MLAEITASISISPHFSINATVLEIMDGDVQEKAKQMYSALRALTQCGAVPQAQIAMRPSPKGADPNKLISQKQLGMLKNLLRENNISEQDFCKQHAVESLDKMPMENARKVIGDLVDNKKINH